MAYTPEDRARLERQWSVETAQTRLSAEDLGVWEQGRHVHRVMVFQDKTLLHYRNSRRGPELLNVLRVAGVDASFQSGLEVGLLFEGKPQIQSFGHKPKRLRPDSSIFLWTAFFPDLQRTKMGDGDFSTWFAVAVKQVTKPENMLNGAEHLVEVKHFKSLFPQYKNATY